MDAYTLPSRRSSASSQGELVLSEIFELTRTPPGRRTRAHGVRVGAGWARRGVRRDRAGRVRARRAGAARAPDAGAADVAGAARQRGLRDGHPRDEHRARAGRGRPRPGRRPARRRGRRARARLHPARGAGRLRVEKCAVVEIEEALVDWMRDGTVPHGPALLADERVTVVVADIAMAVAEARPASYDLVLLDVDNGPGYLVHDDNAGALRPRRSSTAADAVLRPGGVLVVWSADDVARARGGAATTVFGDAEERAYDVLLQDRAEQYWLYSSASARTVGPMTRAALRRDRVPHRARLHGRGPRCRATPCGGPRPSARSRTSRSAGRRSSRASSTRWRWSRPPPRGSTASSACSPHEQADAIEDAAAGRWPRGEHDDAVPDRRLPDRVGHQLQHEHQRGDRLARRPRPASRSTPTTTSTPASPATTPSRPRSTSPRRWRWSRTCCPRSTSLAASLRGEGRPSSPALVKSGRTHLMDATPVMLGQEFGGYAATVRYAAERLECVLPRVRELPLGGTAVGTGINTPPGFAARVIEALGELHRPAVHRGPQPLRGPGHPRLAGRAQRRAAHHRGRPHQDLQRPALDVLGADHRPGRDPPARPAARVEHHARQGQPGAARGHADGLRPGGRQRRRRRRGPARAATSSST